VIEWDENECNTTGWLLSEFIRKTENIGVKVGGGTSSSSSATPNLRMN